MKKSKTSKSTRLLWNPTIVAVLMLPAILFYIVLQVIPSFATFIMSFTDISGVPGLGWEFIGLENYKEFFLYQNYRDVIDIISRTIIFAVSVTLIQNSLALLVAVLLNNEKIKGRNFVRAVVFLPTILGVTIVCFAWSFFFTLDGPAYFIADMIGYETSGFLGSSTEAFPIVIFVQIWLSLGYAMVIYIAGLQNISGDLYEAAAIDGAENSKAFRFITIPLIWPTIRVNVLLSTIGALTTMQTILLLTGGDKNTSTLPMLIYGSAFGIGSAGSTSGSMRQGYASAEAMILFIIVLTFTLISQYFMLKKESDF